MNNFNMYEEILCDANILYKAYLASVKGSKWKESSQRFSMNFLHYIFEIKEEMENRTLKNSPTYEFQLSERGKVRPITSIPIKDRIIRHALCDEIIFPEVKKRIIYDNGASVPGRGISFQRKRFEVHLHKYYRLYGNEGWILFGDFSKFYDNVIHRIAKDQLLRLFDYDEFLDWLLTLVFDGFKIDASYMSDEEFSRYEELLFDKLKYRKINTHISPQSKKWMCKSVNIGDQLSQIIGIYYPNRIDTYVKYVKQQKFYGRYMDDWYIMNPDKEVLKELLADITSIAKELGIHINAKKTRVVKISSVYQFLQIRYSLTKDGKVIKRINPSRVVSLRRKLKKLSTQFQNGAIDYENIENMFKGWMGSHYKLLSRCQQISLIKLYEDLFDKKITISNKKLVIKGA